MLTRVKDEILEVGNENAGGVFSVVNRLDYADAYDSQEQFEAVRDVLTSGPLGGPLAVSYAAGAAGFDIRPEPVPDMSRKCLRQKVSEIPVLITIATAVTVTPRFWAIDMTRAFKMHFF